MAMTTRTKGALAVTGVALTLLAAVIVATRTRIDPPPAPPSVAVETQEEPPPLAPLPPRPESDAQLRAALGGLSSDPRWSSWLAVDDLLGRLVAAVDAISDGRSPRQALDFLAPAGRFAAVERNGTEYVDPKAWARYDGVADVAGSIDGAAAGAGYAKVRSLLDIAYRHFGYPDRRFDDRVAMTITHLLAVPVTTGDVALTSKGGIWLYADPALEALSPAQKHLLRMGPRNVARIQAVLRAFASAARIELAAR